jgi:hypothetical protein
LLIRILINENAIASVSRENICEMLAQERSAAPRPPPQSRPPDMWS